MKFFFYCILLFTTLIAQPALACQPTAEPTTTSTTHIAARPLMRYLVATLRLPKARARAVQKALQAHPLSMRTPEQIAERLHDVLLPQEYFQFRVLSANAVTYENLRALSAR
jgi:hypothetical protein